MKKAKISLKALSMKKFNSSEMGTHKVKYTLETEAGVSEATVKYEVIDTTAPVVNLQKLSLHMKWQVKVRLKQSISKGSYRRTCKKSLSANEGSIKVSALPKEQLNIGINYVRVVARDSAGNVGSAQAIVEIKVKEKKLNNKYKPSIDIIEESTKKKKEETTKKNKEEQTEKVQENEETKEAVTEEVTESVENEVTTNISETTASETVSP